MAPNRAQRIKIAKETLDILEAGLYVNGEGDRVSLEEAVSTSVENSRLWTEKELNELRNKKALPPPGAANCTLEVTEETSIAACRRLAAENEDDGAVVVCLNFASAKNVCGGMVRGSLAQEESLGLCSGLHSSLSRFEYSYYAANRADPKGGFYHDLLVHSPGVPVFREDGSLGLLDRPFAVDFVSCPAVNKGRAVSSPGCTADGVNGAMRRRIRNVLSVSADRKASVLVLGAWGCGVFKNEPVDMAQNFRAELDDAQGFFRKAFGKIVFAICDKRMADIFREILLNE